MTTPDQQAQLSKLLDRIGARDQTAFRALYQSTASRLMAVAMRLLNDRGRAEDVLQEAFVGIWNNAGSFTAEKSQPMTWLTNIVRNKAIDVLRSPRRETSITTQDEDGSPIDMDFEDEAPGPLDIVLSRAQAGAIKGCLEHLDDGPREGILLAFYEGLTHAEVADRMRQPLGTVKSWVRRGLERLKRCLDGGGGQDHALRST